LGLELNDLEKMESLLTQISILTEKLLLASSETKINIRNLLVWLNKSNFFFNKKINIFFIDVIKTTHENDIEIENHKCYLNKYSIDVERLYKMLADDNLFHMKNLLSFFIEDEQKSQIIENNEETFFTNKVFQEPKNKYHSILLESAFKEISNFRNFFNEEMKNEGTVKKESAILKRNLFDNHKFSKTRQNFSETFKNIEETWTQIISKPQAKISKSFSLKNLVKNYKRLKKTRCYFLF